MRSDVAVNLKFLLIPGILMMVALSCRHIALYDLTTPTISVNCDPDTVYFTNDVQPIIVSNCAKSGCHASGGGGEEARDLSSYTAIMNSGYVKPFQANQSRLYEAVTSGGGEGRMPPYPYPGLTSTQTDLIKTWINQGARNNTCEGGPCDTSNVTYSGTIAPLLDNFCTGCHGTVSPSAGINLTSYADVASAAANGSLYGSVAQLPGFLAMPYGGSLLPSCQIDEIRIWVENGYPNN